MEKLYTANVVRATCGVSDRQLLHWVSRDIVRPAKCYRKQIDARRITYLFDFSSLVQVKLAKQLRDAGIPLKKIKGAVETLRERGRNEWEQEWLLIMPSGEIGWKGVGDPEVLSGKHAGQLVFSVVAIPAMSERITKELTQLSPFVKPENGEIVQYRVN